MNREQVQHWIEDFSTFCTTVDVRAVIAAADEECNVPPDYAKHLYAIAIVRALHDGELGDDWHVAQSAVARLWQRGYTGGFCTDSFNGVLRVLKAERVRGRPMIVSRRNGTFGNAVVH